MWFAVAFITVGFQALFGLGMWQRTRKLALGPLTDAILAHSIRFNDLDKKYQELSAAHADLKKRVDPIIAKATVR